MIGDGVCPFKSEGIREINCRSDCQLYDEEKGRCVFAVMAMELEKIRREMKK